MNKLNIQTFVRVDQDMVDKLLPRVHFALPYKEHWALWIIAIDCPCPDVFKWMSHQDASVYVPVDYCPDGTLSNGSPESRYIAIGVSYSTCDLDLLKLLASRPSLSIKSCAGFEYVENLVRTKNPLLRLSVSRKVYYFESGVTALRADAKKHIHHRLSPKEAEFINSLAGHDFFYEYSDALNVYRNGKRREEELKAAGVALGLRQDRVDELYALAYRSKCG